MPDIFQTANTILDEPDPFEAQKSSEPSNEDWIIEQAQRSAMKGLNFQHALSEANKGMASAEIAQPKAALSAIKRWHESDSGKDFWGWRETHLEPETGYRKKRHASQRGISEDRERRLMPN